MDVNARVGEVGQATCTSQRLQSKGRGGSGGANVTETAVPAGTKERSGVVLGYNLVRLERRGGGELGTGYPTLVLA